MNGEGEHWVYMLGPIVPFPWRRLALSDAGAEADTKIIDLCVYRYGLPAQEPEADVPAVVEG